MALEIADIVPPKPTIHLDSKTLPAVKKWQVGKTYEIHMKVRLKDLHEEYDNKNELGAGFEVIRAMECDG